MIYAEKYGNLPIDLGFIDVECPEMMFWLYCPIHTPYSRYEVPHNLKCFTPIINKAIRDFQYIEEYYVYVTAKTLYVTPDNCGNRKGWHSDGFGTNDINYIWYNDNPTEFTQDNYVLNDANCADSMDIMKRQAYFKDVICYPNKHLLKLDQSVIHRCKEDFEPKIRTFVKITISKDVYDLEGNSTNPAFPEIVCNRKRNIERNHPQLLESRK